MKIILFVMMMTFGINLTTHAEFTSTGESKFESSRKTIEFLADTLNIKKLSSTIKWNNGTTTNCKTVAIATTATLEPDLSFLDEAEGFDLLMGILLFTDTGVGFTALDLKKINKNKTVVKFLRKWDGGKHMVIMKLKKGIFTLIVKRNGINSTPVMLGIDNIGTDRWITKSLNVSMYVSNNNKTIQDTGSVLIEYKTVQDKVTKVKKQNKKIM